MTTSVVTTSDYTQGPIQYITCLLCSEEIGHGKSIIYCYKYVCFYHKKCFKDCVNHENIKAKYLGYTSNKYYKNVVCSCGNKIIIENNNTWYLKKFGKYLSFPLLIVGLILII